MRTKHSLLAIISFLIVIVAARAHAETAICEYDSESALINVLRLKGMQNDDPIAGPMSPRLAQSRIGEHSITSLKDGLARYNKPTGALILFANEDESCSFLVTKDGIRGYARTPFNQVSIKSAVRSTLDALEVTALAEARAPVRRGAKSLSTIPPIAEGEPDAYLGSAQRVARAIGLLSDLERLIDVRGLSSIIVVPDTAYDGFPFSLTPVTQSGFPLIDRVSIQIAPALAEIGIGPGLHRIPDSDLSKLELEDRKQALANALVVGNPSYNDKEFLLPDLQGATTEAESVAELLGTAAVLGEDASLSAVMAALEDRPRYVHLATHGWADLQNIRNNRSFVALANGDRLDSAALEDITFSDGAIVVLSACQTGVGAPRPGGMIGLPRLFQLRRAQYVVMSHWNVDDGSTEFMMRTFAEKLIETGEVASSMAFATRETRKVYPNASNWAAFSVFGVGPS